MNKFSQLGADIVKLWGKYGHSYVLGIKNTLILALIGTLLGCVIGFLCEGWETRLFGCSYFWNRGFGCPEKAVAFSQPKGGALLVEGGHVCKTIPSLKVYEGCNRVTWRDMIYNGDKMDWKNDFMPGRCSFDGKASANIDLAK